MFNKLSIRIRLVGITVLILIICCIGLTAIINYSATQMTSQVVETIIPAENLTPAQDTGTTEGSSKINQSELDMIQLEDSKKVEQQELIIGFFYKQSILYMVFIIIVGAIMMYFFSKRILFPLSTLNGKIKSRTISNLTDKIIVPNGNDEISELAVSFNKMTDRIHEALLFQQQFSANVAHELRTPLTILKTKIDVFNKRDDWNITDYKQLNSGLQNQIDRLSDIVQTLLELTNTDTIQEKEYIFVSDIVENVMEDLVDVSSQKHIQFSVDFQDVEMYVDLDSMYQVFYNLIQNSIKYNMENGVVSILAKNEKNKTVIKVSDTGIGISLENRRQIFKPFFCVDKSRSRTVGGIGLGLSIVKNIIDKHGGTISVFDNQPQGTCFIIELPFPK